MKLAIIGGGASGLFLASYLKRKNASIDITIYERNKGLGRKLLATGNGKCNFMNYKAIPSDYNNEDFMANVFGICPKDELLNYFQSLGLVFKFDNEGRMYPVSESAESILSLFVNDLKDTKVLLETTVENIKVSNDKYVINNKDTYDFVILASGTNASIDLKKVDSTYKYLNNLNLNMVNTRPSLVGFKSKENLSKLFGYRSKAKVTYFVNNHPIHRESGEVIFKKDGISGICIMNISQLYENEHKAYLTLDLLEGYEPNELIFRINQRKKENDNPRYYLSGVCHPKMIEYLISERITNPEDVIYNLKNFKITILDTYDESNAQVLKGGISVDEINSDFSLKKYNKIYVTGELLDIDGRCGGYNLTFAFTSAMIAAKSILEKYENRTNRV